MGNSDDVLLFVWNNFIFATSLRRYDLLYGMTELESYNVLNAVALTYGLLENERDNLLRFYMQNRFEIRPDLALAATLNE